MRERHVPSRNSSCPPQGGGMPRDRATLNHTAEARLPFVFPYLTVVNGRDLPSQAGSPAVENNLRHVDGFDQIYGCSFSHQLYSPIARTSPHRGSPWDGGSAETLSAERGT